jgi:hypothetical protein
MVTHSSTKWRLLRSPSPDHDLEHPTPVVMAPGRHRAFWIVVRLIGLLIALLVLPVLILLNLLLYLVILPASVEAIID